MTETYDSLYQETLDFLYSQLPMYQRVGESAFKKGLDNISTLCQQIGYPQWKFKSIHVGGTNGKGSVSSMLSSILMEAGYNRIGLYTSPHLKEFTERIRINGQEIPRDAVVEFVEVWRDVIEKIKPSFFELTVAMAFDYFAEKEIDAAIVEVGLGGRLDSTNIIRPELSVITNISWDHMNLLGDTLPLIAGEKAGIIKPFTPVVIGERQAETASVFQEKAREKEAHLVFASDEYTAERIEWDFEGQTLRVKRKGKGRSHDYRVGLSGHYQLKNLITVLSAVDALREDGWDITDMALQRGLERVQRNSGLQGR
ncbi:MAG: bifunctional folylpolyglutamate synthase/dihydrofolate synthase, partial [Bacteroidetes bacterium]